MRRGLAWLVSLPLVLAGSQVAHVLAYRLVYPEARVRLGALAGSGHGYMALLPLALGVAGAVVAVSLALASVDAARGRPVRSLPPWAFALLPLLSWTTQEALERWIAGGIAPWHALGAPTFLPGLALQLPFGAFAWLAARLLLRAAARVGRALAGAPPRVRPVALAPWTARELVLVASRFVRALPERGPPLLLGA
ncbi:MAG: hypothetical protein JO073_00075 [Actinobacteria bacterium]|nr:hypothetical protein [Actinomycetota bacterium]